MRHPWFVSKDVTKILGYAKHVDVDDKTTTLIQGTGSNYKSNAVCINEDKTVNKLFIVNGTKWSL